MGDLTPAIAFAIGVAGPLIVPITWIVRQFFKVSGTKARVIVWIVSFLITLYAVINQKLIPTLSWSGPEAVVASLATLGALTVGIVTVATAVYKVIDASNWTTADKR